MDYYIFGAHSRGYTLYEYLRTLYTEDSIIGFLFDNDERNPSYIEGIKVLSVEDEQELHVSAQVYLATRGVYHERIIKKLNDIGFKTIVPVTPQLDTELRNKYVSNKFKLKNRGFEKIDSFDTADYKNEAESINASIYIAKTESDKPFTRNVELNKYESIIQVGSVLTDTRVTDASSFDDGGYNISDRNHQFCELTALYWIWKNSKAFVVGLEHWRRRFILPDHWDEMMIKNEIDVILPVPLCVMPSLIENYKCRHNPSVWDRGMALLKWYHPEDYDGACQYFKENNLYSPCNMLITKKEICDELCEWIFPVLLELNDEIGMLEDGYQNRYPGFFSERLLNYFFEKNRDRFRIVYADKNFLE